MSEVFEAIVRKAPAERTATSLATLGTSLQLRVFGIGDGCSVALRTGPRHSATFTEEMLRIAQALSISDADCLLVRYDSRIGHRSSQLFRKGILIREFDEKDEVFVELGEKGEPNTAGPFYQVSELDPDREYETIQDAVELGLAELGCGTWSELRGILANG